MPLCAEVLEDRSLLAPLIAVGTDVGATSEVRILADLDSNGTFETETFRLHPFGQFAGGVRVALGDFDGDREEELVVTAGPGGGPRVSIYNLSADGVVHEVVDTFFAFDVGFSGGLFVAAGDINGSGRDALIVSADQGAGPHVKIYYDFDLDGRLSDTEVDSFYAFDAGFAGGVRVAAGDVDADGRDEVITAAGPGGGPHVIVWNNSGSTLRVSDNSMRDSFFAYAEEFRGGVYVASGPMDGIGGNGAEIITGPGMGGAPHVRIFTDTNSNARLSDDRVFEDIVPAYAAEFAGGVRVAVSTVNAELLTIPGPGGGAHLKVFDDSGDAASLLSDNALRDERFVYQADNLAGFFVAATGFGSVTTSRFVFDDLVGIPGEFQSEFVGANLIVPSSVGTIHDLNVHVAIRHTDPSEIEVSLRHVPSGRTLELFTNIGNQGTGGIFVVLDDEADTDLASAPLDGPILGTFKPENAALMGAFLSVFDGLDASGTWGLSIRRQTGSLHAGALLGWTLEFRHD